MFNIVGVKNNVQLHFGYNYIINSSKKDIDVIFPSSYMQQPLPLQTKKLKISHLIEVEHMKLQHDVTKNLENKY